MRSNVLVLSLLGVVVLASTAHAQVYSLPHSSPRVTAARASWQIQRKPLFHAGHVYYATGPTEFFDGRVMVRTGTYEGVPLYENATIEPHSVVYVPIGGNLVRPYERKRDRDLVGTVGSRVPSFPIQRDIELKSYDFWLYDPAVTEAEVADDSRGAQWYWPTPVDRSAVSSNQPLAPLSGQTRTVSSPTPPPAQGKPRETTNAGAYILFKGARYFTSGRAVTHDIQRFARIGDVGSAAVYSESGGADDTVFIEVVPGGPLAPYTKREPPAPARAKR